MRLSSSLNAKRRGEEEANLCSCSELPLSHDQATQIAYFLSSCGLDQVNITKETPGIDLGPQI